ncbi:MAG: DUF222 domain-containing protein [Ilumatobacter sp.]|uniref:HNH endonuclease signature motif containing protein n=1 Tax=Ilumatobacter sp. TaxID=1967498 RepID=UPI00260F24A8|nr:HNH endonuclease signature motif containing protein [Ilumatobacter sp.]MDJ0769851.1 DUF222 domain-containing protein [Ilumatobacter sp.]
MASISGERADQLAELTCDRRAARYLEITSWFAAVEAGDWMGKGYRSPSAWMAAATGEPVGTCKRVLFLGERLAKMPHVADLFRLGLVSEATVGAVADVWHESIASAFERDELLFADWVRRRPYREAKTMLDAWAATERANAVEERERDGFELRRFSVTKTDRGMSQITGALDNEGTAVVRAALSMLSVPAEGDTRTRGQRNADALVTMARFTLSHFEQPVGTRKRPPKVDVTIPYETLLTRNGISLLDSHVITPDAARRLACDAGVHRMITHAGSAVIDYGRQTRTVPDPLWRLLVDRDGGCRFPGCEVPAEMCDAHHTVHWADGGETDAYTLALLCWFHHHLVHEQHWRLEPLGAGHFLLRSPNGDLHELSRPRLDILTRPDQLTLATP